MEPLFIVQWMEPIKLNSKLIENASKNKQTPSLMEMLISYAGEKCKNDHFINFEAF